MKIKWNEEKNSFLEKERGFSFNELINNGEIIDVIKNANYENQKKFIIKYKNYIYVVPFVENETEIFLKTAFKSRKYKKEYLKENLI